MGKLFSFICIALLLETVVSDGVSSSTEGATSATCGRHGDPCVSSSQCCENLRCHRYANRCQVTITEEDLMKQREKILGRRSRDY